MENLDDAITQFFTVILLPFCWIYIFFKTIFTSLKSFFTRTTQTTQRTSADDIRISGGRKKK